MENYKNLFILAGNGSYENHGYEAIIRGSINILNKYYDKCKYVVGSYYPEGTSCESQIKNEKDKSIFHFAHKDIKKYSKNWFLLKLEKYFKNYNKQYYNFNNMNEYMTNSKAILSVGGDNYSLDYGLPYRFTNMDDYVIKNHKPLIIWGASVGPFTKNKLYENYMKEHLNNVTGIFARESMTIEYLDSIGIRKNVYRVCDPAFYLESEKINDLNIIKGSIGINISPIMRQYVSINDGFEKLNARIIEKLVKNTNRTIYLIPHVVFKGASDYALMKDIFDEIEDKFKSKVILISDKYSASEYKWIISNMEVFFGARTHATIAALSTLVPTLSFVYSIKSVGINKDLFGTDEYCIYPEQFNEDVMVERIKYLIDKREKIQEQLKVKVDEAKKLALKAGEYLKEII